MALSEKILGNNREHIPNWAFKLMSFVMKLMDFTGYHDKNFKILPIKKGQTVVDYGCGPARYTLRIAKAIGNEGQLISTDIHPLAIKNVKDIIKKHQLTNVQVALSKGYECPIPDKSADVLLALDMFHMVEDTNALLHEFERIVKPEGIVIIEDGHQSRETTKKKILDSGCFIIINENKAHVRCTVHSGSIKPQGY